MAKKKKTNFASMIDDAIVRNERSGATYGYMQLPKNVHVYAPDANGCKITFDIMPYVVTSDTHPEGAASGDLWWRYVYFIHRNIGAGNETVVCPSTIKQRCPICEHRTKRLREQAPQEETKALKASERNLFAIIPLDDKKLKDQICLFDISKFLFTELLLKEAKENPEYKNFADLEEGASIRVRFESSSIGGGQPFAEASRIDFIDRDHQYEEEILDDIPALDEVLNILPYKELQAKFWEIEHEEDGGTLTEVDDEEEEEVVSTTPRRRSPATTRSKKVEKEPEPEDDEEEELEEEEPKEKPTRRSAVARGSAKKKEEPKKKETTRKKKEDDNECPHGHEFGKDFEQFDDCETCEKWDECADANEQ